MYCIPKDFKTYIQAFSIAHGPMPVQTYGVLNKTNTSCKPYNPINYPNLTLTTIKRHSVSLDLVIANPWMDAEATKAHGCQIIVHQ